MPSTAASLPKPKSAFLNICRGASSWSVFAREATVGAIRKRPRGPGGRTHHRCMQVCLESQHMFCDVQDSWKDPCKLESYSADARGLCIQDQALLCDACPAQELWDIRQRVELQQSRLGDQLLPHVSSPASPSPVWSASVGSPS